MLISTHTLRHKHKTFLHNSPAKGKNGLGREHGKAVLITIHILTHKHNELLHNSPAKGKNGLSREHGKAVHKHVNTIHFFTTHRLKEKIDWAENKEVWWSFHSYTNTQTRNISSQLTPLI